MDTDLESVRSLSLIHIYIYIYIYIYSESKAAWFVIRRKEITTIMQPCKCSSNIQHLYVLEFINRTIMVATENVLRFKEDNHCLTVTRIRVALHPFKVWRFHPFDTSGLDGLVMPNEGIWSLQGSFARIPYKDSL